MPEILPFPNASAGPFNVPSAGKLFVTPGEQLLAGALPPAPVPTGSDSRKVLRIAIGIAAAFMLYRMLIHQDLPDSSPEDAKKEADKIWEKTKGPWVLLATSAVLAAYKLGSNGQVTDGQLEVVAHGYALEMGEYIHQTSSIALSEGVESQLLAGWSDKIAWQRAKEGYGLDGPQMRSYLTQLVNATKSEDTLPRAGQIVPESFKQRVQTMLLSRSDRIGESEAWASIQTGKALNWLFMVKTGRLTGSPKKRWITAEDELVCLICGPLHGVSIPVGDMFESKGHKFFAPGVHPNCRCELQLIEDMPNTVIKADQYKRDWQGRFAHVDSDVRPAERVRPERAPRLDLSSSVALLEKIEQNLQTAAQPQTEQKLLVMPTEINEELGTIIKPATIIATPKILPPEIVAPQILPPQILTPQILTPQILTPQILTPQTKVETSTVVETPTTAETPEKVKTESEAETGPREIGWGSVPIGLMDQFSFDEFEPLNAGEHRILPFTQDDSFYTRDVVENWLQTFKMHVADYAGQQSNTDELSQKIKNDESRRIADIDRLTREQGTSAKARKDFALAYVTYLNDKILVSEVDDSNADQALIVLSDGIAVSDLDADDIADASSVFSSSTFGSAWEKLYEGTPADNRMRIEEAIYDLNDIEQDVQISRQEYNLLHSRLRSIGNDLPSMEIVSFPEGFDKGPNGGVIGKYKISPQPDVVEWNSRLVPETLKEMIKLSVPSQAREGEIKLTVKIYKAIPVEQT